MSRTGNSFLRRILELILGIYTGSDMSIDMTMHLVFGGGMAGEEAVAEDNICWITKSHWPIEDPFGNREFNA